MLAQGPVRWREIFRGRRGRFTAGLLLLEALVAIQSLVVATILPDVRDDLGMVELYGLVFTAASLATIATIPIAGRRGRPVRRPTHPAADPRAVRGRASPCRRSLPRCRSCCSASS